MNNPPVSRSLRARASSRFTTRLWAGPIVGALACVCVSAYGQDYFTGADGVSGNGSADPGAYDYSDALNWSSGAPNVNTGGDAIINNGDFVDYFGNSNGDFIIADGGELQLASGSFKQANGGNWEQLQGNATLLVDGGNFIQGTDGNNPFNVSGSNNLFEITSGSAGFTGGFIVRGGLTFESTGGTTSIGGNTIQVPTGGTYTQTGGSVTDTATGGTSVTGGFSLSGGSLTLGGEFDYNASGNAVISGGTLTTTLITGANGPSGDYLTISGGEIIVTGNTFSGFYAGDNPNRPVNFTLGSTGVVDFLTDTESQVQTLINDGGFQYNGAVDTTDLQVTPDATTGYEVSVVGAVPEPQTWGMLLTGMVALAGFCRVRRR